MHMADALISPAVGGTMWTAAAVTSCAAPKILLPLSQEPVILVGFVNEPLPHLVQMIVNEKIKEVLPDV